MKFYADYYLLIGLWMFAGMAIRMAQDLGLHRTPETNPDSNLSFHDHARLSPDGQFILNDEQSAVHQQKARLVMFWSVFIMDVCVSLVTGRPPTIRQNEIEVPVPTYNDMKLAQLDFQEQVSIHNMIFPETVRFMMQFSEAVVVLNQRLPAMKTGSDPENLSRIRQEILKSYATLPSQLTFSVDNYRESSTSAHSGLFLMLHLFFYTFVTLLSNTHSRDARQGLHHAQRGQVAMSQISPNFSNLTERDVDSEHQSSMGMMASQKIVQILTIAELVDQNGYLATPFTNHSLFVAASTLLQDAFSPDPPPSNSQPTSSFFSLMAGSDYDFLLKKLHDQGCYFGGVNSVAAVLEKKVNAMNNKTNGRTITVDDGDMDGDETSRIVGLGDTGIVNRYTIPR